MLPLFAGMPACKQGFIEPCAQQHAAAHQPPSRSCRGSALIRVYTLVLACPHVHCRGQWAMMLRLEESLRAARVSKPLISALVNAFRSHAYYCPLDDRMYMPFTHSSLATRRPYSGGGSGSGTASGTRQTQLNLEQQHLANSVHMSVQDLGQAAGNAAAANLHAARCTWLYTVAAIRKGEEILVANNQQHDCDWPGLE